MKNEKNEMSTEKMAELLIKNTLEGVRKEYYKKWRKNNKDKIKKYNENFWKKQAKKINNKEQ